LDVFHQFATLSIEGLLNSLARAVQWGRSAFGEDWSPLAREVLRARAPELAAELEDGGSTVEDEIDRIYEDLHVATRAGDEPRRRELFARVEVLETAEAERLARYFQEHSPFNPEEARATRERARALLNNANSSSGNTSS
jgi:hypothetical protein